MANGLKTLTTQKAVYPLIYNPLADTSAIAWLLVFENLGNSSPNNGISNGSITMFFQTLPSISAVRFLIHYVFTSPPFGQDKACCKLNESPQIHSVGKRSREMLYLIRIAYQKACFSRKKTFLIDHFQDFETKILIALKKLKTSFKQKSLCVAFMFTQMSFGII